MAAWIDQELLDDDGELREDRIAQDALIDANALLATTESRLSRGSVSAGWSPWKPSL